MRTSRHASTRAALPGSPACPEPGLHQGIEQLLQRFGHLSDSSSDFTRTPWRENPDLILQMVIAHAPPATSGQDRTRFAELKIPVLRRPVLTFLYHRARLFRWYREAISSLYTYGYGLFRNLFRPLGEHIARHGLIEQAEDIFYLSVNEVREIVNGRQPAREYRELVKERKDEIERMKDIVPPELIFGTQAPTLERNEGRELKGTPTSRGVYTGPVRVLRGMEDIGRLLDGDVLVIPYSDVGWTPLFAKAGAVIAESGGILSHSSIIAREYGIPAVVSVPDRAGFLMRPSSRSMDTPAGLPCVSHHDGVCPAGRVPEALRLVPGFCVPAISCTMQSGRTCCPYEEESMMDKLRWIVIALLALAFGMLTVNSLTVHPLKMALFIIAACTVFFALVVVLAAGFRGKALWVACPLILVLFAASYVGTTAAFLAREDARPVPELTRVVGESGPRTHRRGLFHPWRAGDL